MFSLLKPVLWPVRKRYEEAAEVKLKKLRLLRWPPLGLKAEQLQHQHFLHLLVRQRGSSKGLIWGGGGDQWEWPAGYYPLMLAVCRMNTGGLHAGCKSQNERTV